ncbi:hypothetical protein ACH46_10695 [Gordonia phthalatica]|uniref:Methyltransferase small domain-containing protein n=1 Tax=Gordonia phthalatica TaxID=1136941 RepID=A0A0N9NLV9_9ACTN|nr:hypothetical protein ACH46_10695 [Gordonia phthalatica]
MLGELDRRRLDGRAETTVLELCAGSGIASICAALVGATVTAVDDTAEALAAIDGNATANGVAVTGLLTDVRALPASVTADVVIANPPYIPAPPTASAGHAWDAGDDGRDVLDAIIDALPARVRPGGGVLLVQSDVCGVDQTVHRLDLVGFSAAIVDEVPLAFGPVMASRAEWLEQHGFIAPGQRTERLVVTRAVRDAEV